MTEEKLQAIHRGLLDGNLIMHSQLTETSCFDRFVRGLTVLRGLFALTIILCAATASAFMFDSPGNIVLTGVMAVLRAGISRLRSIPTLA
jgi:hypothetical protein